MTRRFRSWLTLLAPERKDATDPAGWVGNFVLGTIILASASFVPGVRELFDLSFVPAYAAYTAACLFGWVACKLEHADRLSLDQYGIALIVGAALFQSATTVAVALSIMPGSVIMAALSLVVVSFHAYIHKVSIQFPFGALPTVVAIVVGVALDPSPENLAIWAVLGPVMLGFSFILGTLGVRAHRARIEQRSLIDALHAQVLQERTRDRDAVSSQLLKLLEHNHDASNTLSSVMLKSQLLSEKFESDDLDAAQLTQLKGLASSVTTGLSRLRDLLDDAREVRLGAQPKVQAVAVMDVISMIVVEMRERFPRVEFKLPEDLSGKDGPLVTLVGGATTLARILENLLLNACQGDGVRGAREVVVGVYPMSEEGRVSIEVADDGPGFPPEQLASETFAFQTSKPDGLGLGLYTVASLVGASGGAIVRENRSTGGARVSVQLPVVRA